LVEAIGVRGSPERSPLCAAHWREYLALRQAHRNRGASEEMFLTAWLLRLILGREAKFSETLPACFSIKRNDDAFIEAVMTDIARQATLTYPHPLPTVTPDFIDIYAATDDELRAALQQKWGAAYADTLHHRDLWRWHQLQGCIERDHHVPDEFSHEYVLAGVRARGILRGVDARSSRAV
jgi:hypothetical protein